MSSRYPGKFRAFFRQSYDFPENFSVGLAYDPNDGMGETVLLRCNGQHGVFNGSFDPAHPHWGYHIHRASAAALNAGLKAEKNAELTDAYGSYREAVQHFIGLINLDASDASRFFPSYTQESLVFGED